MSKRLIILLALAFVVGLTVGAYAEVQNVKISGDITAYGIGRNLTLRDSKSPSGVGNVGWDKSLASIARVRIDADLTDNVMATVRLLNERYWGGEYGTSGALENNPTSGANSNIDLDLAYVTLKEFLYSPLTVTVGRQELHFGSEMIVGDPDTNNAASEASAFGPNRTDHDLSARKAFDTIRLTLNYDPLVIDMIAAKVKEKVLRLNDDTDLYGINANYALNKKTTLEAYWFEKREGNKLNSTAAASGENSRSKVDQVDTVGARIAAKPIEDLVVNLEGAYQFGRLVYTDIEPATDVQATANRSAFALEASAGYTFKKVKYTPSATLLVGYFSGEGNHFTSATKRRTYHAWDPMYENQTTGNIANALFPQSNVTLIGGIATAKPMDDITLKGEYYAYWWNKRYANGDPVDTARDTSANLIMTDKRQAAQELDLTGTYDYTEDVQLGLMYGILWPGQSFDNANRNIASEVIGSMKVTF